MASMAQVDTVRKDRCFEAERSMAAGEARPNFRAMRFRTVASMSLRIPLLTLVHAVLFMWVAQLLLPPAPAPVPSQGPALLAGVLADSALTAGIAALLVLRPRWRGFRLAFALAGLLFAGRVFMPQIETAAFPAAIGALHPGVYAALWSTGLVVATLFALSAVALLGRFRGNSEPAATLPHTPASWGVRLTLGAVLYTLVYFTLGYWVAWQVPEIRAFYTGSTRLYGFWEQMRLTVVGAPMLPFFQLERGLFWMLLAVAVVRLCRGGAAEAGLTYALFAAVTLSSQLFIPGDHMGPAVRMAHFRECFSSMLLFGALAASLLLRPSRRSP